MSAMTYGTIEIIKLPDGSTDTLNFVEAQKKYGDLLEKADTAVKERFAPCITHFKAKNNIGRNGFELQKLLASVENIRVYTDHLEWKEGLITFGEAQEKFGMGLELLTADQRAKFEKELARYQELTKPKNKELDLSDISPIKPEPLPNIYVITCTKVHIANMVTDLNDIPITGMMEFFGTQVYEGKYYVSLKAVLEELEKLYNADLALEKRRPHFFHVKKMDKLSYVYSEVSPGFMGRYYYIYAISPLSQSGTNPAFNKIFDDLENGNFILEGTTYKEGDLY